MDTQEVMSVVSNAISKAEHYGFKKWWAEYDTGNFRYNILSECFGISLQRGKESAVVSIEQIIYKKEFLKAFYGVEWEHHAKQQVISEDPIQYLKRFI